MRIVDALLQELEREAQTTRRVLERVPDAHLGWKPHEKSMTLGQLALHIATLPAGVAEIAAQPFVQAPKFTQASVTRAAELIPALEQAVARAKQLLGGMDDNAMAFSWRLMDGDRELLAVPRGALLRSIMLNHWYHHRGQLTVYLRQLNVPVPSIYGPSADENPFAVAAAVARA
jgi:uncharacterized damage-inducible protein DinB